MVPQVDRARTLYMLAGRIRGQRLQKARKALIEATPGTHITDVTLDAGYTHLTRLISNPIERCVHFHSSTTMTIASLSDTNEEHYGRKTTT